MPSPFKKLSATSDSAIQARDMVQTELPHITIEIIDSKTTSGSLGWIVLEAARAAKAGIASIFRLLHVVEVI